MKVKSESEVAQSCSTFHDLMDCSLPGSSVHGIFQARVLEWGAMELEAIVCDWLVVHVWLFLVGLKLEAKTKIREAVSYEPSSG